MTETEWRKPCPAGCTCGKHKKRTQEHPAGCMCGVHGGKDPEKHKGHSTACKEGCTCSRHRPSWNALPEGEALERRRAYNRAYAARRRATDPAHVEQNRERNRTHGRRYHLKSKYGISLEQWDEILISQSGRCYLCADPLPEKDSDRCLDHDHACCPGKKSCGRCIRGLACRWCNQGLGQFRDDPERMRRAADALEAANARLRTKQLESGA